VIREWSGCVVLGKVAWGDYKAPGGAEKREAGG
jgi:hypothetical protein